MHKGVTTPILKYAAKTTADTTTKQILKTA
jgi:hypothetical protein